MAKNTGFTMIESLIAIFILSIGLLLYAKNWTANLGAKSSTHARSIASTQVAEIGNVLLANVSLESYSTSKQQVRNRVRNFSNALQNRLNGFAKAKGYECKNSVPTPIINQNTSINIDDHTLPRVWAQGAASCITITLENTATGTNGVWVKIEANWLDANTEEGKTEKVSTYTLVSPL